MSTEEDKIAANRPDDESDNYYEISHCQCGAKQNVRSTECLNVILRGKMKLDLSNLKCEAPPA